MHKLQTPGGHLPGRHRAALLGAATVCTDHQMGTGTRLYMLNGVRHPETVS